MPLSTPAQVEAIFFAALEMKTEAERSVYLDCACGDDPELRNRVERLLKSHRRAANFLAHPALERHGLAPLNPSEGTERISGSKPAAGACGAPSRNPGPLETQADPRDDDDDDNALAVLEPSKQPGSLGRLGHYEVVEVLGKGSFGTVVKALDDKLRRFAAIKLMSPLLASTSAPRKRFLREARSAAAVRHQSVVAIYAVEDKPTPYLVMEYIAGQTLQQKLDATGPLEVPEVVRLGRQIAEGLAAAHATGLIHRDIKPSNILLEHGIEQAKITDFGLARAADDASISQSGLIAGTPMYMAPEQARGESIDHRADLFSLGSVLYTMCSGRPPFRAANTMAVLKRVTEDTPRPIREIIPEVPEWLCDLIARLHAKDPADRFASAQEVADALARHSAGPERPAVVRPSTMEDTVQFVADSIAAPVTRRPKFRKRGWLAAASVLLVLFGSLGFTEATGVTDVHSTVIRLFSREGTLVVEVDDPGIDVRVDGSDIIITGAGVREIRLRPGRYAVQASKNGKLVRQELVNVTQNGRQVVRVSEEAPPTIAEAATPSVAKPATLSPDVLAWERVMAALSATEQVKAVGARLKELNPGFNGRVVPTIEHGAVRELEIKTEDVSDISPLRVLTGLRSLTLHDGGARRGPLSDLSPLSGLPLTSLFITSGQLFDLSPLKGMPLTELRVPGTLVYDLSPLQGMPLRIVDVGGTKVVDLTVLTGMKLDGLEIGGAKIYDLSPLKGMNLNWLSAYDTPVFDLSPLQGMKLKFLHCRGTKVSDLSPLKGMPLTLLNCSDTKVGDEGMAPLEDCKDLAELFLANTRMGDAGLAHLKDLKGLRRLALHGAKVSDLSPLKDVPLDDIRLTPKNLNTRGLEILRGMKSLKTIGTDWNTVWPEAEFWDRCDKGEFNK
jgi:hypothetical protein